MVIIIFNAASDYDETWERELAWEYFHHLGQKITWPYDPSNPEIPEKGFSKGSMKANERRY